MGFLDSTAVTIDATLTRLGRKRLVDGNFKIDRFALSDEGVDYTLYDINHPSGSDSYGTVIENMNVLEVSPVRSGFMSYLIDDSLANRTFGLDVDYPPREEDSSDPVPFEAGGPITLTPNQNTGLNESYFFTIEYTRIIKFDGDDGKVNILPARKSVTIVTQEFGSPTPSATTKVIVRGADSGMSAILTVTVNRTEGSTTDVGTTDEHALRFKDI